MYEGVSASIWKQGGETDSFSIKIGLHQSSTLSPYLLP